MTESVAIDKMLQQAGCRSSPDTDLLSYCEDLISAVNSSNFANYGPLLRQLFIIVHSTRKKHCLSPQVQACLIKILLLPDRTRIVSKISAGLLLTELSPSPHFSLLIGQLLNNDTQIPFILPVIFALENNKDLLTSFAPLVIRWLSTVGFNADVQTKALSAAVSLIHHQPETLSKDHQYVVDCQIGEWLKAASLHQGNKPGARGIFKRDEQLPITELDGRLTQNLFTALCLCQHYTDDQLLNMHSFALLQHWLYYTRGVCPYASTKAHQLDHHKPRPSASGQGEGSSRESSPAHSVVPYPLEESSLQYVLRVLEQWDRKPKALADVEVQQASVAHAVGVLDQLCQSDLSIGPRAGDAVKRLYGKLSPHIHQRVLVTVMQFYLNHSEAVMLDSLPVFEMFFGSVVGSSYANPAVAFDTVMFVEDNREILVLKTSLLTNYFPNLFKILAWDPHTYVTDYANLLPAFLSPTTSIEVFHALLDLPLLTAALEVTRWSEMLTISDTQIKQPFSPNLVEKLRETRYKPLLKFILRAEGGKGDTIDRLDTLHNLLTDFCTNPRVMTCADTVPILLTVFFDVILSEGGRELASTLVPVLLERSRLLYRVAGYQKAVHGVLAEKIGALFGQYPHLIADQFIDIADYVGNIRNITEDENLFVHVVWVVGEYLTSSHDVRVTPDRVAVMFDTLETVAYEVVGRGKNTANSISQSEHCSPRLITTIMSALAKLASRSQDLIPRVMLCLTKLGQAGPTSSMPGGRAVTDRAAELLSLLQVPNIAAMVLSPHPDRQSGRWHTDNTSLPAVLHATSSLLHP